MKTIITIVLIAAFSVTWAQSNSAIIDTEQMQQAVARGAIIWDVRGEKSYLEGHLPGAINVGEIGSVLRDPNKGLLRGHHLVNPFRKIHRFLLLCRPISE